MTTAQTAKAGPQKIDTRIGALEFTHDFANGYPTERVRTGSNQQGSIDSGHVIKMCPERDHFRQ